MFRPGIAAACAVGLLSCGASGERTQLVLFPDMTDLPPETAVFGLYKDPPQAFTIVAIVLWVVAVVFDTVYVHRAITRRADSLPSALY